MAGRQFVMDDTAGGITVAAFCSALSANSTNSQFQGALEGAGGTGTTVQAIQGSASALRALYYVLQTPADLKSIAAGSWTVTLDITSGNSNLTWVRVTICRLNSSGVNQATILADATISVSMATGVQTSGAIAGSSAATLVAGDQILVILSFTNGKSSSQSFTWKHDGAVTMPAATYGELVATLAGAAAISPTDTMTMPVSETLAGAAVLIDSPGTLIPVSATAAGAAALTDSPGTVIPISESLGGAAAFADSAQWAFAGTSSLAGAAAVSPTDIMTLLASETIAGAAAFTDVPGTLVPVSESLAGAAALTDSEVMAMPVSESLDGAAAATMTPGLSIPVSESFAGAAAFADSPNNAIPVSNTYAGAAALTDSPNNSISVSESLAGSSNLTDSGGISIPVSISAAAAAGFSGSEIMTLLAAMSIAGAADCTFSGGNIILESISIDGAAGASSDTGIIITTSLELSGNADLADSVTLSLPLSVALSGAADSQTFPSNSIPVSASADGAAGFSDSIVLVMFPALSLAGSSTMSASVSLTALAACSLIGVADLLAIGDVISGGGGGTVYDVSLSLDGTSDFADTEVLSMSVLLTADANGELSDSIGNVMPATAMMAANADAVSSASNSIFVAATCAGATGFNETETWSLAADLALTGSANETYQTKAILQNAIALDVSSSFRASGVWIGIVSFDFAGAADFDAQGNTGGMIYDVAFAIYGNAVIAFMEWCQRYVSPPTTPPYYNPIAPGPDWQGNAQQMNTGAPDSLATVIPGHLVPAFQGPGWPGNYQQPK